METEPETIPGVLDELSLRRVQAEQLREQHVADKLLLDEIRASVSFRIVSGIIWPLSRLIPVSIRSQIKSLNAVNTHNRSQLPAQTKSCAPAAQGEKVLTGALLPPRKLQDYVGGGFLAGGPELLRCFVKLCDLKPHESMLDVGCGSGRIALPLTGYLNQQGHYEGFDISADAIKWCSENITAKYPHFKFQAVEIHNAWYQPTAKRRASDFRFPYGDEAFDFVFLTSVFTHMLPADMQHYFAEIARVLKRGGRCLMTLFLLNDESTVLIDNLKGEYNFEYRGEGYRTISKHTPETAVAYPEPFIRSLCEKYGFKVREPIRYGSWCGRVNYVTFQDLVIADKWNKAI
jgi:SAM-dependent methyltransferase